MKGLLIKDLFILFQRKQTLLMFVLISVFIGYSIGGNFIVGYMCFLSVMLAVSTVSYDDADNGLLFLMTCPISRRDYVLSKYILCVLVLCATWLLGFAFMAVLYMVQGAGANFSQEAISAAVYIPIVIVFFSMMIPVQLKFGAEKSRLVLLLFMGAAAAMLILLTKIFGIDFENAGELLERIPDAAFIPAGLAVCVLAVLISFGISVRIMENKKL